MYIHKSNERKPYLSLGYCPSYIQIHCFFYHGDNSSASLYSYRPIRGMKTSVQVYWRPGLLLRQEVDCEREGSRGHVEMWLISDAY